MLCLYRQGRGWFFKRPKTRVKPTVKKTKQPYNSGYPYGLQSASSGCQWRYGLGYLGCKNTASKTTTTAPRKVLTPAPVETAEVSKTKALDPIASACTTQLKNELRVPSDIIKNILKKPHSCKKLLIALRYGFSESTPSILEEVKRKYVKKLVVVERPFGIHIELHKDDITSLNEKGIKTSISGNSTTITHSGVLVTTEDDKTYLIHKIKKGENADNTVKTRVEYRPNLFDDPSWKAVKTIKPKKQLTINDYYKITQPYEYNFFTNNCHDATERMIQLAS